MFSQFYVDLSVADGLKCELCCTCLIIISAHVQFLYFFTLIPSPSVYLPGVKKHKGYRKEVLVAKGTTL